MQEIYGKIEQALTEIHAILGVKFVVFPELEKIYDISRDLKFSAKGTDLENITSRFHYKLEESVSNIDVAIELLYSAVRDLENELQDIEGGKYTS